MNPDPDDTEYENEDDSANSPFPEQPDPMLEQQAREAKIASLRERIKRKTQLEDDEINTLLPTLEAMEDFLKDMQTLSDNPDVAVGDDDDDCEAPEDPGKLSAEDERHAKHLSERKAKAVKAKKKREKQAFDAASSHLPPDERPSFEDAPPASFDDFMKSIGAEIDVD